jgi:hypothetical protein
LRALGAAEDASIAYGHFRRFAILIPGEKLLCDTDANITWFESATCVPLGSALLRFVTRLLTWLWSSLASCSGIHMLSKHQKTSAQGGSGAISKQQFPSKQQAVDRLRTDPHTASRQHINYTTSSPRLIYLGVFYWICWILCVSTVVQQLARLQCLWKEWRKWA